jgi:Putative DNA-binding domain
MSLSTLNVLQIPMELEIWNMAVLENLLKYREIERDSFDFKGPKLNNLESHICAMANTVTGILALGVDDPSSDSPMVSFTKNGFRKGTEEPTLNSINNYVAKVDPLPMVTHIVLPRETDPPCKDFYVILKVAGSASQRPYMIKDASKIFVRVGGSTRPGTRTTIANLFINLIEMRKQVQKLQVHSSLLRSELILTAQVIDTVDSNYTGIIPLLDLQTFTDSCLSADWFLSEQNLLGRVDSTGTTIRGLYVNIHELNILNTTIDIVNREQMNRGGRYPNFAAALDKWKPHSGDFKNMIASLDDILIRCKKFLHTME